MSAALTTAMLIFVAEVGDKTQLLVAALAGRFPVKTVFLGIAAAVAAVQAIAVTAGHMLAGVVPVHLLHLASAAAFFGFCVWSLRDDSSESLAVRRVSPNPLLAIAFGFFLAELGDKTQLAALTLSARFPLPLHVWAGAVVGMLAADSLGLVAGYALARRVDGHWVRLGSSLAFLAFSAYTLWTTNLAWTAKAISSLVMLAIYLASISSSLKAASSRAQPRKARE
ncbi:MAG: TMEM165/GDT1 family protein [Bacillota bacterium]